VQETLLQVYSANGIPNAPPSSPNVYTYALRVHSFYARISLFTLLLLNSLSTAVLAPLPLMILAILCRLYHLDMLLPFPFLLFI
jgi:hypothetical protein